MHVTHLRDGEPIQFLWQIDNRQNKASDTNIVQLSHRDAGETESENRRQHRSSKAEELATTPRRRPDRLAYRVRGIANRARYFLPEQNRYQRESDQRKQSETDEMPDEDCRDGELRNEPVPIAARHSCGNDSDQSEHHCGHENGDQDPTERVIRQARENDPPDDIQRNHQTDDGKYETHGGNLLGL